MSSGEEYLTKGEVLKRFPAIFGSRATLDRMRADGSLPYYKIKGRVLIRLIDIEILIESHRSA